jgi:ribosomal protein L7/L12
MNDIVIAVVAGAALFFVTSFVTLAVWAINAKINAAASAAAGAQEQARLNEENERLKLEARIAKDLVKPAVDELRDLVRKLEEQFEISESVA